MIERSPNGNKIINRLVKSATGLVRREGVG